MKKIISIVLVLALVFLFASCKKDEPARDYNEDNAKIEAEINPESKIDFKAKCSLSDTEVITLQREDAYNMYNYLHKDAPDVSDKKLDTSGQKSVMVSFQSPNVNEQGKINQYGTFIICENDVVCYNSMKSNTSMAYYQYPKGTYDKVMEMINGEETTK